jgi:hypothetical protein
MLRQRLTFRYVSYLLAAFLAVTAALKLHLLLTDPFADIKTGTSITLLWFAVFVEVSVVWIVLSKLPDGLTWIALISLFSGMAIISAYNYSVGKTNCGCIGRIELSPMIALTFDAVIVIAVGLMKPAYKDFLIDRDSGIKSLGNILGTLLAILLIGTLHFNAQFASKYIVGEDVDLGNVAIRTLTSGNCRLRNLSGETVSILGFSSSCSCVVLDAYKNELRGGQSLELPFQVFPTQAGAFRQRINFYVDAKRQHRVAVNITAFIYGE